VIHDKLIRSRFNRKYYDFELFSHEDFIDELRIVLAIPNFVNFAGESDSFTVLIL
jgi:hypothetical protein